MPDEIVEEYRSLGPRIDEAVVKCGDQIDKDTWKYASDSDSESEEDTDVVRYLCMMLFRV